MQSTAHTIKHPTDILQNIRKLIASDIDAFSQLIQLELNSVVPLTREITQHIFHAQGKQLRPLLVLLAAKAISNTAIQKQHLELAVVIEFVHTATLLHDDVVDHSILRRGQKTANALWGNAASILVGDFLYSRAFQILARHQNTAIMQVLSETTNAIAEGEVMQLMKQRDANLSEENYFYIITQKTAKLFSATTEIGAMLNQASHIEQKAMSDYGLHLGITFQLIDDLLDYETSAHMTGKNIGDDLSEGKTTFPLIYALQRTNAKQAAMIQQAISQSDHTALENIIAILRETQAFSATRNKAAEHAMLAKQALQPIATSCYRTALEELIEFALHREF